MKAVLTLTELAMLIYWVIAGAVVAGLLNMPPEWMYSDYDNSLIVNWNWSFFPIDVLFALTGLTARFGGFPAQVTSVLRIVSLSLMFCAGLMAVSFWTLQCWFDLVWWSMNLWLMGLAMIGLVRLMIRQPVAEAL